MWDQFMSLILNLCPKYNHDQYLTFIFNSTCKSHSWVTNLMLCSSLYSPLWLGSRSTSNHPAVIGFISRWYSKPVLRINIEVKHYFLIAFLPWSKRFISKNNSNYRVFSVVWTLDCRNPEVNIKPVALFLYKMRT